MPTQPDISVIVPAYAAPSLRRCLEHLLAQQAAQSFEIIVVHSGVRGGTVGALPVDPRLTVVAHERRLSAAAARNEAVGLSRGRTLVFTDADAFAEPGWLSSLVAAAQDGSFVVAGAIVNGTPGSLAGSVEYLVEFLDLHPLRPPESLWHGATCNLLIDRGLFEELGPFPEDLGGGEDTLLTVAAHRRGLLRFAPAARVVHQNRTAWSQVVRHQVEFGEFTARLGRRSAYRFRPLVRYSPLAPVAFLGRVASLYVRAFGCDVKVGLMALRLAPGVIGVLGAWSWGLWREGLRLDLRLRRPVQAGESAA